MLNISTKGICISSDIVWLNRSLDVWKDDMKKTDNDEGNILPYNIRVNKVPDHQIHREEDYHPNYNPVDILSEENVETVLVEPTNLNKTVCLSPNVRTHRSGMTSGMTCMTTIINKVEPNTIDQDCNYTNLQEKMENSNRR